MNPVEYFNKNKREKYWSKNSSDYKCWFEKMLNHLLIEIKFNSSEKEMNSFIYRLGLGYWGIGVQYGLSSGIKTQDSVTKPNTKDHVFGTVEIGKFIHSEFEKNSFDIDYMVNEWLYENLWLWMTIKVSKEEHKKENIERNSHTLNEKKELRHYKNISDLIFKS